MLLHSLLFIVICGTVPAFGSIRGVQPNKEKHYQGTEVIIQQKSGSMRIRDMKHFNNLN